MLCELRRLAVQIKLKASWSQIVVQPMVSYALNSEGLVIISEESRWEGEGAAVPLSWEEICFIRAALLKEQWEIRGTFLTAL